MTAVSMECALIAPLLQGFSQFSHRGVCCITSEIDSTKQGTFLNQTHFLLSSSARKHSSWFIPPADSFKYLLLCTDLKEQEAVMPRQPALSIGVCADAKKRGKTFLGPHLHSEPQLPIGSTLHLQLPKGSTRG